MTPRRQRYIEDMQLRNYSPKTPQLYGECVSLLARQFQEVSGAAGARAHARVPALSRP